MVVEKLLLSFTLTLTALTVAAQRTPQQMQQTIGRVSNEQKAWQQSKMPAKHFYKNNYAYSYPLYQNQPFVNYSYIGGTLPIIQRLNLDYNYNMPTPKIIGGNAKAFNEWKKRYLELQRYNESKKD